MDIFERFNTSGPPCVVCQTRAQLPAILVPIPGTEEDGIHEALQVHAKCWAFVTEMKELEANQLKEG